MDWPSIIISLILTAVAYMAFPLIKLLANGGRFPKNRAHKIALWNSIALGAVFCIATIAVSEDGIPQSNFMSSIIRESSAISK